MTACLKGKDHRKIPNDAGKAVAGNSVRRVFFSAAYLVRWTHCNHTGPSSSERGRYNYRMHPCVGRSFRYLLGLKLRPSAFGVLGSNSYLFLHLRNGLGFLEKKNVCFLINTLICLSGNEMLLFYPSWSNNQSLLGVSKPPQIWAPPYL